MRTVLDEAGVPVPAYVVVDERAGRLRGGRGVRRRPRLAGRAQGRPRAATTARACGRSRDRAEAAAVLAQVAGQVVVEELRAHSTPSWPSWWPAAPRARPSAWPAVETAQVGGVCREVLVPGRLPADVRRGRPSALGQKVAEIAGGVGVMAVELFWSRGRLLVNEVATRPHNSGHWTIEGAVTSQFENHVRAVLDLPLGSTAPQHPQVASVNVFGGPAGADPAHLLARGPRRRGCPRPPLWQGRPAGTQTGARDGVRRRRRRRAVPGLVGRHRPRDPGARRHRPARRGVPRDRLHAAGRRRDGQLVGPARSCRGPSTMLERFGVPHEVRVVSAHRTPRDMLAFGQEAAGRGLRVLIAGAGGAAHLPGMLASVTTLPVIGVPVALSQPRRPRQPALHRADAQGRAGGDDGGQRGPQRRPAGRAHPGPGRPGPHGKNGGIPGGDRVGGPGPGRRRVRRSGRSDG